MSIARGSKPCKQSVSARPKFDASNQPFTAWEEIFPSSSMTVAAVDRLVHHCRIVQISGESHRRQQAAQRGVRPEQETPSSAELTT
jgi:hypothetical protein